MLRLAQRPSATDSTLVWKPVYRVNAKQLETMAVQSDLKSLSGYHISPVYVVVDGVCKLAFAEHTRKLGRRGVMLRSEMKRKRRISSTTMSQTRVSVHDRGAGLGFGICAADIDDV